LIQFLQWLAEWAVIGIAVAVTFGVMSRKMAREEEEEREQDECVALDGCGAVGPYGYRCTHHENGHHVARGTEKDSFGEAWPL
jgi:hypothetical protein